MTKRQPIIRLLTAAAATLMASAAAYAVPARPTPVQYTQADGQTITVKIRGDENSHYYLTEDDYLLINIDNIMYYGNVDASGAIKSSGIKASPALKRTAAETSYLKTVNMSKVNTALDAMMMQRRGVRSITPTLGVSPVSRAQAQQETTAHPAIVPGTHFPVLGDQKTIVILVQYDDVKFNLDDPYDYFSRMFTDDDFSDYGATGSVAKYFRDNSNGKFNLDIDLYGPVTLSNKRSFYGKNDMWGNDEKPHMMAVDACQLLDDTVDFSQYDCDGDGLIDNVFIFYADTGEASGGPAESVWPHSWYLSAATSKKYTFDGVQLEHYACTNEWYAGRPDGIGTFVHEFSHVMGLPDLYSTTMTTAFTPDAYDVLDYGPYNNNGNTPPNYSIYARYALGWLEPTVLDSPADITLQDITTDQGCIIETPNVNEYYLIENRQQKGWDKYIPGHGMLIWHIDFNRSAWMSNSVNDNPSHQHVDLIEADNKRTASTRDGDTFPGAANVTSFTDTTTPSMVTWANESIDMPITDIAESDGVITFKVRYGTVDIGGVTISVVGTPTPGSIDLAWDKADNATCYLVSVYTGDMKAVDGWEMNNVGDVDHVTVGGLSPETTYTCIVYASNGYTISKESNAVTATTAAATIDFMSPVALDATEISDESFTACWEALPGAQSYMLTVYTKGEPIIYSESNGFKDGLNMIAGWQTTATQTFYNKSYCGQALPSLRLGSDEMYIMTPDYDQDLTTLSFWTRGWSAAEGNSLCVYAKVKGSYVPVAELMVDNDATNPMEGLTVRNYEGQTIVIDNLPTGTRSIKLEYHEAEHKGAIAVDDVTVEWGREYPIEVVDGYDGLDVGQTLTYAVTGLNPQTQYYYTVTATDGTLTSLSSNEIMVETSDLLGITDIESHAQIRVIGDCVHVNGTPGMTVALYDLLGRLAASVTVSDSGTATLRLPSDGVYVLRAGDTAIKISK